MSINKYKTLNKNNEYRVLKYIEINAMSIDKNNTPNKNNEYRVNNTMK